MKIQIIDETAQVYTAEYGVPTIHLGDGETSICDIHSDEGFHGIAFVEAEVNNGVGADRSPELKGKKVDEIGAYLQIITDNPESINVLIDQLYKAKAAIQGRCDTCKGKYHPWKDCFGKPLTERPE